MLNVLIPDQVQTFVKEQAAAAGFSTPSDYICHLVLQEQQRLASLKGAGLGDLPVTEVVDPVVLMRLPLTQRRQALALQAAAMIEHYEQDAEWKTFTAGDIVEY